MGWGSGNLGGGSGGLNFKIVGGTSEPSNPKENTIWVITDVPITTWIFSPTQPEPPADGKDGAVWFLTGTSSGVAFNALKKNAIEVYPMSAKQYVGGAWVKKEAKSYRDGKLVDWTVYAYNGGNTGWQSCTSAVGGWYPGSVTFSDGAICLKNTQTNGATGSATTEKYDLSSFKTIEFVIDSQSTGFNTGTAYVCVTTANSFAWNPGVNATTLPSEVVSSKQFNSDGIVTLDVSSLSGEYYLAILIARVKTVYCTKVSITA